MTLVKFNGKPVVNFNPLFEDFFNFSFPFSGAAHLPATNVWESANSYHLELNAPGRNKEDFKISVDKGLLTISYEHKDEKTQEDLKTIRREFKKESFTRSFTLDEKIDATAILARYENGVLKLDLPKKETAKDEPKLIAIS